VDVERQGTCADADAVEYGRGSICTDKSQSETGSAH
jgi:hypothetical protein